jgi:hypothetical protein
MEQVQPDMKEHTPSSRVLENLLHQAPPECFTLGWLMSHLQQRSFGIVFLVLGLLATTPIGSTVPGLMLAAVAIQMVAGRRGLVFELELAPMSPSLHIPPPVPSARTRCR